MRVYLASAVARLGLLFGLACLFAPTSQAQPPDVPPPPAPVEQTVPGPAVSAPAPVAPEAPTGQRRPLRGKLGRGRLRQRIRNLFPGRRQGPAVRSLSP